MCKVKIRKGGTIAWVLLFACVFAWCVASVRVLASGQYEIDASNPREGAKDVLSYTGSMEEYEVKVSGVYDIEVFGAQAGPGIGHVRNTIHSQVSPDTEGGRGSHVKSRVYLEEGMRLAVYVGGQGGQGILDTYDISGNRAAEGGWPDGGSGTGIANVNTSDRYKSAAIQTGGGGGSTYIMYNGEKVISAKGGNSADMWITSGRYDHLYAHIGIGGGENRIQSSDELEWMTSDVKVLEDDVQEGNGRVVMTLRKPEMSLTLSADTEEWTRDDVTIEAVLRAYGSTLPTDCFFWENVPSVDSAWTNQSTVTVSKNGTYRCIGRDNAGNEKHAEIKITNIDRDAPHVTFHNSMADWTSGPVTISIDVEDGDGIGPADNPICWTEDAPGSWDDENEYEIVWTNVREKTVEENGRLAVLVRDRLGNKNEETYTVTNIDHTAPTVSLTHEGKWTSGEMLFYIEATDLQPDGRTIGCGLAEEAFSLDGEHFQSDNTILVTKEGEVVVWVRDALGNLSENHVKVSYDRSGSADGHHHDGHKDGESAGENVQDSMEDLFPADLLQIEIDERLREYKELTESHSRKDAQITTGVLVKEDVGFEKIATALGAKLQDSLLKETKDEDAAMSDAMDAEIEEPDEDTTQGGLLTAILAGKKWVTRFIQKWKHVIAYSLTGIICFGLMGLGCFLYLIKKRKK